MNFVVQEVFQITDLFRKITELLELVDLRIIIRVSRYWFLIISAYFSRRELSFFHNRPLLNLMFDYLDSEELKVIRKASLTFRVLINLHPNYIPDKWTYPRRRYDDDDYFGQDFYDEDDENY